MKKIIKKEINVDDEENHKESEMIKNMIMNLKMKKLLRKR